MEGLRPGSSPRCLVGGQERVASAETRKVWAGDKEKLLPHKDRGWVRGGGGAGLCHLGAFQASTA